MRWIGLSMMALGGPVSDAFGLELFKAAVLLVLWGGGMAIWLISKDKTDD